MKMKKIMAAALTLTLLTPAISKASEEVVDLEKGKAELILTVNDEIKNEKVKQEFIKRINEAEKNIELQYIAQDIAHRPLDDEENTENTSETEISPVEDETPAEHPVYDLEKEKADFILYVNDNIKDEKLRQKYIKEINEAEGMSKLQDIAQFMHFDSLDDEENTDNTNDTSETETPSVEDETAEKDTLKPESKKIVDQQKNSSNLNENSPVQKINSNNKEAGKNAKTGVGSLSTLAGILVASAYAYKSTKKEN